MKRVLLLGSILMIAVVVGAAGVYGYSRLSTGTALAQESKAEKVMVLAIEEVINGERFGGEVRITFEDPPELPDRAEDAAGLFLSQQGNEMTLGTGSIDVELSVEVVNDEEPTRVVNASHDGGEMTFTVDKNTVYLKDVTLRPEITEEILAAGQVQVTRILEAGSLYDISENTMVRAWGEVVDGHVVADLVVYEAIQ